MLINYKVINYTVLYYFQDISIYNFDIEYYRNKVNDYQSENNIYFNYDLSCYQDKNHIILELIILKNIKDENYIKQIGKEYYKHIKY